MDIIFIYQKLSSKPPEYINLFKWMKYLNTTGQCHLINISEHPGEYNLTEEELDDFGIRFVEKTLDLHENNIKFKIIALGDFASNLLKYLNLEHFKLPHPCKKSSKLKDKNYIAYCLNECYAYIRETGK